MNKIVRPGAASYLLLGILFGGPAIFAAALSFQKHLPLFFTPQIYFAWTLPIAIWLYLSSLKLGMSDQAIYLERFFFQRLEFQFTDIASARIRLSPFPTLEISVIGHKKLVSIALGPFDKRSLTIFTKTLKDNVKNFEDQTSVAMPNGVSPTVLRRLLPHLRVLFIVGLMGPLLGRLVAGQLHRRPDPAAFAEGLHRDCVAACLKANPTQTVCPQFCDCFDRTILDKNPEFSLVEFDRLRTGAADGALKARYQRMQDRCRIEAQHGKSEAATGP
jgi:hypothetical protein